MLIKKKQYPEVDELVLAKVTKVNPNSVFTVLEHYNNKTALIHISEISPGRIRNIRDYVVEGKKIIGKILKIDREKGHIDLSLRRVTDIQRRNKNDEIKQEQKSEKLIDFFFKENKLDVKLKIDFVKNLANDYENVFDFFNDVVEEEVKVEEYFEDEISAKKLEDFIKDKIKPSEVEVKNDFKITLFDEDGSEIIKKIVKKSIDEKTEINYLGSGTFSIKVKEKEFKDAESIMKEKMDTIEKEVEKLKGLFSFERKE